MAQKQHEKLFFPVNNLLNFLSAAEAVTNLGVWFDTDFSFSRHIGNNFKTCSAQIRDLRHFIVYLMHDAALIKIIFVIC